MTANARGTGRGLGRGREAPSRLNNRPLAPERPTEAPESAQPRERPTGARTADPTSEPIPGQTELPLTYRQVTLWSL